MSTDQPTPEQETSTTEPSPTIADELALLGRKLAEAARTVLESPQRYEVEEEVRDGFQTVVDEVNQALGRARQSDVAKDVGQKAGVVYDNVRSSQVTQDLRAGLVKGLQNLNNELEDLVNRLQKSTHQAEDPTAVAPAPEPSSDGDGDIVA